MIKCIMFSVDSAEVLYKSSEIRVKNDFYLCRVK